jgi:heptose-I-phosphate ethanolaminephosphotransferase
MKSMKEILMKALGWAFMPIQRNARFFVFMYLLGVVVSYATLPDAPKATVYGNLWLELFIDVFLLCIVLAVLPRRVRRWVRLLFAMVAYVVAVVDVFCFVRFKATLNPTMLLLVGETDSREAGEFLSSYVQPDILLSGVGAVLLVAIAHGLSLLLPRLMKRLPVAWRAVLERVGDLLPKLVPLAGIATVALTVWAVAASWENKCAMHTMFSKTDMGQVEHELTKPDHAVFYQPIYRLVFSIFSNHLAAKQIEKLIVAKDRVEVDSCSFRSPTIVLIIGESYNKYHSQLYGYEKATSPRLLKRQKNGRLVTFSDVVAPWNLTSFVFKNVFSMHVVGQQGEWCDYPLFPEVFRKAGYKVAFITNQFLPKAKEAVYDFSGGFFLNNTELSESQFDVRNDKVHVLDEGILSDYDAMVKQQRIDSNANNLIIFHVMGQHVNYNARYPKRQRRWHGDDYDRPDLTARDRDFLSHYDNATLYNDSIADQIISRFEDKNAIVIYFSDHGEECFDDGFKHFGRNHSAEITPRLAHQEFDVPFWVWCSHDYAVKHPDIFQQVLQSKDRRLMTDALPHMLLYLAGISSKDYNEAYNILSPHYNEQRPRVIKNGVDYDKLMKKAKQ